MEPGGSLPHSQQPATCPNPEPAQSSPRPIPRLEDPFSYYPPIYAWVSQVVVFPQVSPPKSRMHLSFPPYMLHAPPISFFSIWLRECLILLLHNWLIPSDLVKCFTTALAQTEKLRNDVSVIAICVAREYVYCRPSANEHSLFQCSIGHFTWRPTYVLLFPAT
jgi:hypothetical protein